MRRENTIKLSFNEVALYVGDRRVAHRIYRSLRRNQRTKAITVFDVDGWILRRLPRRYWPEGLSIDGVNPERAYYATRRDYGTRLQQPGEHAHGTD